MPRKNDARQLVNTVFPRDHQLDATRAIVAAVRRDGPGDKYLIQHSAGSGKTNSIAWTAHFLADLHDVDNRKVFDTVVVVSDRTVLDDQLQEAIMGFERTQGVVAVNYTSYKVAFNLAHEGGARVSEVDRDTAIKGILGWVRLHEYNIAQHTTAELAGVSDPEQIYTLRAKLDGLGFYDTFEVDRVVEVVLRGKDQSALDRALVPVADRLIKRYAAAQRRLREAEDGSADAHAAKLELDALILFKRDLATYVRLYGFLSQIFNYGNTGIEKRAIFFRLLHKLLCVDKAIKGKLLECETLIEQAVNNTKEQFGNSPDLDARILDAVMNALSAFTSMSRQALESERIRAEIKSILLGPGRLYELLRQQRSPSVSDA